MRGGIAAHGAVCIINDTFKKTPTEEKALHSSRAALDRLLDPSNTSVTLATLTRAAAALGRRVKIELVPA